MNEFSFRSTRETENEQRGRSKRRKKNKPGRWRSGSRPINSNGSRQTFCTYCYPALAVRRYNRTCARESARTDMLDIVYG